MDLLTSISVDVRLWEPFRRNPFSTKSDSHSIIRSRESIHVLLSQLSTASTQTSSLRWSASRMRVPFSCSSHVSPLSLPRSRQLTIIHRHKQRFWDTLRRLLAQARGPMHFRRTPVAPEHALPVMCPAQGGAGLRPVLARREYRPGRDGFAHRR